MKALLRNTVKTVLRLFPAGAPEKIYATLFRGFLGRLVNPIIIALLPKTAQIPEGAVVLNAEDPAVSGAIAFGAFEPYETDLFRKAIKPGMTVIDIGANIGLYTVIAAKRVGDRGRVIAFEPAPENFEILQKTIRANFFSNVSTLQFAVADKEGELSLNLYESNKGKHSLVKDSSTSKGFSTSIRVRTVGLDEFLRSHGVESVDVVKMDIEGAESIALLGMNETFDKASTLFLEFTPSAIRKVGHDPREVLRSLRDKGFTIRAIHEVARTNDEVLDDTAFIASIPETECANLLCERRE